MVEGSLDSLAKGQIAVADFKAEQAGWHVGQTLPLERQSDQRGSLTIGAIYQADEQSDLMPSITAPDSSSPATTPPRAPPGSSSPRTADPAGPRAQASPTPSATTPR